MQQTHHTTLKMFNGAAFFFASPGPDRHNSLLVDTIELFAPRYTPGAYILRLQDPTNTVDILEQNQLQQFGLGAIPSSDMPDILLYQANKQALFCIDVLTMHGFVSSQRKQALEQAMTNCPLRRVYISSCYDFCDYKQIVERIAWGTYVWLAHTPEHTIFLW
ncbi:hypothetical protein KDH_39120 [Dictyobacter sp. S3.2.2.5]|uniref:BsuBI/PstI restriction endonuclease domain-containing protein n=1 Tax=Dictyobacter halimunensis TaxID=3026934 RepID=A0ABQ6FU12_9CHLR|nr:hypothetical protein KDH_39120 [Dictyobacter sp. S3.2.2.5]